MATPILMPKQGQSVESCIITEWYKKKGEKVEEGETLFSYETDKASFEETAPASGILLDVFFGDGDEVPVLVNVAVIGEEGESTAEFASGGSSTPEVEEVKPEPETVAESAKQEVKEEEVAQTVSEGGFIKISPRARNLAEKLMIDYKNAKGTGPQGRIIERDIEALAKEGSRTTRLAQEKIQEEGLFAPASGDRLGQRAAASEVSPALQYGNDYEDVKLSNMRKIIAKNMHASLQNSAQLTHHLSADARKIMVFRKKAKQLAAEGQIPNITLNDVICYCVIKAIKKQPEINAHFLGDTVRKFKKVHLGIAVDTERGLMVPALRNADDLNLEGLSNQLKNLAESCKKGSVDPELLASEAASFTVSNLGSFGIEMFTPVINIPQSGILGVNTIIQRPAMVDGGVMGFVPFLGLSLTYDHRALDGAPASLFLKTIKEEIENFNYQI